jgi:hypothetical protein
VQTGGGLQAIRQFSISARKVLFGGGKGRLFGKPPYSARRSLLARVRYFVSLIG